MRRFGIQSIAVLLAIWAAEVQAGQPTVSNLNAQQVPGTEVVQINFDLAESEGLPCWIFVQVDRDNLDNWIVPVHALSGDAGPGILPGSNKSIQWNAGLDYDHQYIPITKVKVLAHSLVDGVPEDMVLVPAGSYTMGSNEVGGSSIPEHMVYLDAFWIDKYEVTNLEYKRFCDATSRAYPLDPGFSGMSNYFINYPSYPVVNVNYADATAYASWAGKRLPTEAEWERAAKGAADNRLWPWGSIFNAEINETAFHANISGTDDGWAYTSPVGSYPTGVSPTGCLDMAGNVWEWVNDWYDAAYYSSSPTNNPPGPVSGTNRVLRGGGWDNGSSYARCAYRSYTTPTGRGNNVGFRCARTP